MSWSIQDVTRLSGVTARTLRHYDAIGLLRPHHVGANGYRYYELEQLLRLQEILLLREFGLDLAAIAAVVEGTRDRLETLRSHRDRVLAERERLQGLVETLDVTIAHLEKGAAMPAEEIFSGLRFTPETIDELEARARNREGQEVDPYFAQLRRNTAGWTPADFEQFEQQSGQIERRLLALMRAGAAADDDKVFAVLDEDVAVQSRVITLDADEYAALGRAFVAVPELRAHLDAQDPHLAEYLRDAMVAYAEARLRAS